MNRVCKQCRNTFDDAEALTYCPHELIMPREDLDRKIAALALMNAGTVRFNHQPDGPYRRIQSVSWNGMVTVEGMSGEFAPHLFVGRVQKRIHSTSPERSGRTGQLSSSERWPAI